MIQEFILLKIFKEAKQQLYSCLLYTSDAADEGLGVDESITISGEALSFLSTGIDTRVYFIKNF